MQSFPSAVAVMLGPQAAQSGPPFSKPIVPLNSSHWHRRPAEKDVRVRRDDEWRAKFKKRNGELTVGGRHEIPAGVASHARQGDRVEVLVVAARARIPVLEHSVVRAERTREGGERNDREQVTIAAASGAIHICCASRPDGVAMTTDAERPAHVDFTGDPTSRDNNLLQSLQNYLYR